VTAGLRRITGDLVRAAGVAVAIAVTFMAVLFAVNALVFSGGPERVRETLQRAIADGSILEERNAGPVAALSLRKDAVSIYRHDCLLWTSLIAPVPDLATRALRTYRLEAAARPPDARVPLNPDCQAVAQVLASPGTAAEAPALVWYDRYIMAQRPLVQLLLAHLPLQAGAKLVKASVFAAFALVFVLAWRRRTPAVAVVAAVLLLFYGLGHFGSMLYFAPLDLTHAAFLLLALYRLPGTAPPLSLAAVGGAYGSLVAGFEILTGGIPMGLVLISLVTGLTAPDQRAFLRRVSLLFGAFAVAVVACFAIKLAVVSLHSGTNMFTEHFGSLTHRLRGDFSTEADRNLIARLSQHVSDARLLALLYLVYVYGYWSLLIGWGSPVFGTALVAGGAILLVAATAIAARRVHRVRDLPPALSGCWLAIGFATAWVVLFWNHTLVHPFFMARLLVIPLLCGAVAMVEIGRMRGKPRRADPIGSRVQPSF
jgi:hypothetical protein